jgi:hypothetical protein
MVEHLDRTFWSLRERLERELTQEEIAIRAQEITRLYKAVLRWYPKSGRKEPGVQSQNPSRRKNALLMMACPLLNAARGHRSSNGRLSSARELRVPLRGVGRCRRSKYQVQPASGHRAEDRPFLMLKSYSPQIRQDAADYSTPAIFNSNQHGAQGSPPAALAVSTCLLEIASLIGVYANIRTRRRH